MKDVEAEVRIAAANKAAALCKLLNQEEVNPLAGQGNCGLDPQLGYTLLGNCIPGKQQWICSNDSTIFWIKSYMCFFIAVHSRNHLTKVCGQCRFWETFCHASRSLQQTVPSLCGQHWRVWWWSWPQSWANRPPSNTCYLSSSPSSKTISQMSDSISSASLTRYTLACNRPTLSLQYFLDQPCLHLLFNPIAGNPTCAIWLK